MNAPHDDLFDRARAAGSVLDVALGATKLRRSGKEYRGVCPLSGCGSKGSWPFVVQTGRQRWKCYVCEPRGGDVIDLEHRLHSTGAETMRDAARRLVGDAPRDPRECARRAHHRAREAAQAEASDAFKAEIAARIWREAVPAAGTLVETYLTARRIFGPVLARMLEQLRFHPRAYWGGHPQFGTFLPAMVGLITAPGPDGRPMATGGVHCTYLAPSGRAKSSRTPAKKMFGPQGLIVDGALRAGGVWLTRPDAEGPLVVAEGIESAASAAILKGGDLCLAHRAVAALSLDRLQGGERRDVDGRINVHAPEGDPARPAFVWPEDPARPWGGVFVAVDRDMRPLRVRGFVTGRTGRVRDCHFVRDGEARARVCATLAVAAWKGALAPDSATKVRAIQPGPGRDFNDELMAKAVTA